MSDFRYFTFQLSLLMMSVHASDNTLAARVCDQCFFEFPQRTYLLKEKLILKHREQTTYYVTIKWSVDFWFCYDTNDIA